MTYPAAMAVTGAILFAVSLACACVNDIAYHHAHKRAAAGAGWAAFAAAAVAELVAVWWAAA